MHSSRCEDSFFFLGVYTPYTVPIELDGHAHSLVFQDGADPAPIALSWCQLNLPDARTHSDCTAHIVARADKVKVEWREKSMNYLLEQAEVLNRDASMKLLRPLPGELFVGPAPFMVVTWDATQGACSPSVLSNVTATYHSSGTTCDNDGNISELRSSSWQLLVLFRPTLDKSSGDQVLVDVAIDPEAGSWSGLLKPLLGAKSDLASFGTVHVAIVAAKSLQQRNLDSTEGYNSSNYLKIRNAAVKSASCVSAAVPMGHSGTGKGTGRIAVSLERGDRGGAATHASLMSWALAYQAGLVFAGSLRPMIAAPSPLLALLGLPSASHVMMAKGLPAQEINAVKDVYIAANADAADGWSVSLLSKSRVLAWMNNYSSSEAEEDAAAARLDSDIATDNLAPTTLKSSPASVNGPSPPDVGSGALDTWFTPGFRRLMRSHLQGAMVQPARLLAPTGKIPEESDVEGTGCYPRRGTIQRPWNVAVHVRRGDVRHDNEHYFRHLPNAHFLHILRGVFRATSKLARGRAAGFKETANSGAHERSANDNGKTTHLLPCSGATFVAVHVFSESVSDESFVPFLDLDSKDSACAANTPVVVNVSLHLDSELEDTWAAFKDADILLLSKSTFSYVPALYRHLGHLHDAPDMYGSSNSASDGEAGSSMATTGGQNLSLHSFGSAACSVSLRVEPQVTLYTPFWHAPLRDWLVVPPWSEEASADTTETHLEALSTAIADQLAGVPSMYFIRISLLSCLVFVAIQDGSFSPIYRYRDKPYH